MSKNRLEVIANGLGLPKMVWNRSCRGGGTRLSGLGAPENGLEPSVRGRRTEVKAFGTAREEEEYRGCVVWNRPGALGTERQGFGTGVTWFGSGREVREGRFRSGRLELPGSGLEPTVQGLGPGVKVV